MNDTELMRRYVAGEEEAFQELVSQYKDGLYAFLGRFLNQSDLVDDAFQETLLQLYLSRDTFDLSRPFRPWLFTIAANKAKDALRGIQRIESANLGGMLDSDEPSIDDVLNTSDYEEHMPDDDLIWDETAAAVIGDLETAVEELNGVLALLEHGNGGSHDTASVEPYVASE